jgi:hypothetical protein
MYPAAFSYTAFHRKLLFRSLIIQRVQNDEIGISHHSMDNQAPKKETFDEKRYITLAYMFLF